MAEAYRDRRAILIGGGAVQILLGCATAAWALRIVARAPVAAAQGLLLSTLATLYFFATGLGSIRCRRWARALIAAISGAWAACGALVAVVPLFGSGGPPRALALLALVAVVIPLVLTIVYSSRDVALTADALDPKPRWSDRAPVPVLALGAVLAFAAVESLILSAGPLFTIGGAILTGAPASLAYIVLAILFAHLAIQLYRLRQYAWWVLLLLHVIGGVLWAAPFVGGHEQFVPLTAATAVAWFVFLAFLIWLRRRYRMFSG